MPGPATVEELVQLVERAQVVDQPVLQRAYASWQAKSGRSDEPAAFAQHLIDAGVITSFHAEQLLAGRYKGFRIGAYRILRLIGVGGMGRVYLAEHAFMKRRVALKILPKSLNKEGSAIERFQREAQAVAALNHAHIVHAYDSGQEGDVYFLAMEYVAGESVQDYVKRFGRVPWPYAADFIRQAAEGLQHAADNGLVHRDIKPGNLLVDLSGTVKLVDLGLAMFFTEPVEGDPLTLRYNENVLGTADYLAPEQAVDSHNIDIRADIYSLGGTLYYLLTGQAPFPTGTIAQKLLWHQQKDPEPVTALVPDVPRALEVVLRRMMAKRPEQRYETAAEVAAALAPFSKPHPQAFPPEAAAQYEAIAARPVSRPPQTVAKPTPARTPKPSTAAVAPAGPSSRVLPRPVKPMSLAGKLPKGTEAKPRSATGLGSPPAAQASDAGLDFLRSDAQAKSTKRDLPSAKTVAAKDAAAATNERKPSTWVWAGAGAVSVAVMGALVAVALSDRGAPGTQQTSVRTVKRPGAESGKAEPPKFKPQPFDVVVSTEIGHKGPTSVADGLQKVGSGGRVVLLKKPSGDWDAVPMVIGEGPMRGRDHVYVIGEDRTVSLSTTTPEGPLFHVKSTNHFVIKDLIIDGYGRSAPLVVIEGSGVEGCRIENVIFQNFMGPAVQIVGARGVKAASGAPVVLKNCVFKGAGPNSKGVVVVAPPADPSPTANLVVEGCRFVECNVGIGVQGALTSGVAKRNIFSQCVVGVLFAPGAGLPLLQEFRVERSTFWKQTAGVVLDDAPVGDGKVIVFDCLFVEVALPPLAGPQKVAESLQGGKNLQTDRLFSSAAAPSGDPARTAIGTPPTVAQVEFVSVDPKNGDFLRPRQEVGGAQAAATPKGADPGSTKAN
jgi:serine/threonine protein kinase